MTLPAGVEAGSVEVAVALPGDAAEVTRRNNSVPLLGPTRDVAAAR